MKKFICILISFFTISGLISASSFNSIKMTLSIHKNKNSWSINAIDPNLKECLDSLKKLSSIQQQRKLTIEELNFAYYLFIIVFTALHQEYSSKITISVDDAHNLNLPFSSEILVQIISKILEDADTTGSQE